MELPKGFTHQMWAGKDRDGETPRCHEYIRTDGDQIDVWVGGRACGRVGIHGDFKLDEIIAVLQHAKTLMEVAGG